MQDDTLLTHYAQGGSEAAFGQLVARHLSLVYATCLRETGSPSLAEDAAQVVFLLLARKAKSLRAGPSLAGWLYQTSRFVAKDIRKQEARRCLREQTVMQEITHRQEPPAPECQSWQDVAPLLNDALSALKPGEREAVLLRFLEGHSLAETGAALSLTEDAARMRVSRAVDKDAPLPDDARRFRHRHRADGSSDLRSGASRSRPCCQCHYAGDASSPLVWPYCKRLAALEGSVSDNEDHQGQIRRPRCCVAAWRYCPPTAGARADPF